METAGDIKTAFYPLIGDADGVNRFVTQSQAQNFMVRAVRDMAVDSRCFDTVVEYTWQADDSTHSFGLSSAGTRYMSAWRVEVDDEKVLATTRNRLREHDRDWQQRTGKPYLYYLDEMTATSGLYSVGLYPTASTNISTRWYFSTVPDVDTTDAAYIPLPRWAIPGVLFYMLAEFYRMPGTRRNMKVSKFYRALYEDVKLRLKQETNSKLPKDRTVGGTRKPGLVTDKYRGDISTIA